MYMCNIQFSPDPKSSVLIHAAISNSSHFNSVVFIQWGPRQPFCCSVRQRWPTEALDIT